MDTPIRPLIRIAGRAGCGKIEAQGGTGQLEYLIAFWIKNAGIEPVAFDHAMAGFVTAYGDPIQIEVHPPGGGSGPYEMRPGSERQCLCRTGEHTEALLNDAGDKPIQLHLWLEKEGKRVGDQYFCELPPLDALAVPARMRSGGAVLRFHQVRGLDDDEDDRGEDD